MNTEEQTLIDGLFDKLKRAETDSAPRDAQAEALIKEHLTRQPAAPYYMAQAILVQEVALKQMEAQNRQRDEQIQQLQAELQRAKAQAPQQSGGFLSSIFGSGSRESQPQQPASSFSRPSSPPPSGNGWRDGPASPPPYSPPPQGNYGQPQQQAPAAPFGSGFLGGALKTAAGVAGGVMLAEGISSLFHHNSQPQEIVEIIEQQPAQPASDNALDNGGWGDDQQRVTSNDNWGNDTGGFADTDYGSDDGGFFGGDDDDSYV
ncbi:MULTISPECIES: DUF2076 domain-containing protein [unclassified Pseudomonas]|uniref:DUF2076 domain-containing protein n=1 Tax=unclassified Pseudomonas TaxID=196821 RepID=UPI000D342C88|nr:MULTISPECIES: DUF2076 domain-containing protein [unclassified Pseudomonas]RAU39453.1 DUF2076 domain-containing protein [Pseudomonas sp. RIT 409]RAU50690.1 DUF2076 domain-containing protein [Pseudomonas sp. RIT 412]